MTAHVLISGQLFREPEQRTSKAGKPFVTALRQPRRAKKADVGKDAATRPGGERTPFDDAMPF